MYVLPAISSVLLFCLFLIGACESPEAASSRNLDEDNVFDKDID